jgi:hypothetical protein
MGELEGRSRRLARRAARLEEEVEQRKLAEQRAAERVFAEALSRVSLSELRAMHQYFEQHDREEWTEEDEPLMRRLLALVEEVRNEEAGVRGKFLWQSEIEQKE